MRATQGLKSYLHKPKNNNLDNETYPVEPH